MKVVIFCGGFGLRMRSGVDSAPKPMMTIGDRPVLWHVMRYYAHFGHTEFILCLGFGGSAVKEYFLRYEETHLQRLRDDQGRAADRAARLRHQRVEDHLRRHRDRHQHRRTAAPGPAVPGGRRRVPGQLRRRADRRPDGQDRRPRDDQRHHRQPARGPAAGVLPRGRVRHRRPDHRAAVGRRPERVDQRRVLRAARRRSSTSCTRTRTWSATRSRGCPRCASWRRSRTTGSGRRWTPSRSAASSRSCTAPARSRGRCGATRPGSSRARYWTRHRNGSVDGPVVVAI